MLIWIFAANAALAVLYAVIRQPRRESAGMAVYFIFLPVLGFLIYFLPDLLQMFLERMGVDREAILIHAFEVDLQPEHPDVREALNVAPVEDAMAVSGNTEKRDLLLKQLKKDLKENYQVLLAAERDRDSESAHYAAVAKTEIYRLHQTRWLECCRDYAQDPGDPEKFQTACEVLTEMLESGVLSSREQSAYQKRLCGLVQGQIDAAEGEVFPKEYEEYFLDNFPMITPEDDELCRRLYGYSAEGFVRDVMWPTFQGVSLRSNTHYTSGILAAASSEERFETGNDAVLTTICKSALKFGGELAYAVNCQEDGKIVWNQDFIDRFSGLFTGYTVQGLTMETDNFSPEMLDIPGAEIRAVRGMLESRDTRLSWGPILP